jgi:transcription elongation factor GreA
VTVLTNVTIKNTKSNKTLSYKLVSESEADLKAKRISVTSPIGQGLLGKKIGEVASIKTPRGNIEFEIIDISI